jgi:hypothetical protein
MICVRSNVGLSFVVLLAAGCAFSQVGDGEFGVRIQCKIKPVKTAIRSNDTLQARCIISRDVGHFYVAVDNHDWEIIGTGRWEMDLKEGEQRELHFAVKLLFSPYDQVPQVRQLSVRIRQQPFGNFVTEGWGFSTPITILDSRQLTDSALSRRNPAWLHDRAYMIQRNRRWNEYLKSKGKKGSIDDYLEFERREDSVRTRTNETRSDSVSIKREQ